MRTQVFLIILSFFFTVVLIGIELIPSPSFADAPSSCFDFSRKIDRPMAGQIPPSSDQAQISGERDGLSWAHVSGDVDHSLHDVLSNLLAHRATKSGAANRMTIKTVDSKPGWVHQKVDFVVKPFLFVTVKWTEDWGFSTVDGSSQDPHSVIVAYEKTSGTGYIKHLCGDIQLKKLGPDKTEVSIYEEAKASHRSQKDTLNGIKSTLVSLQAPSK